MDGPQQRSGQRQRALKRAAILLGPKESEIACAIRDIQKKDDAVVGLRLRVVLERSLPEKFLVHVPVDSATYECALRWRRNDECGVEVLAMTKKPDWHYG